MPLQTVTLLNQHAERGHADNLWRVGYTTKPHPNGELRRLRWTVLTPADGEDADIFRLLDRLAEAGLNPGSSHVYVYATTIPEIFASEDRWMLDAINTLIEVKPRAPRKRARRR